MVRRPLPRGRFTDSLWVTPAGLRGGPPLEVVGQPPGSSLLLFGGGHDV